MERYQYQSLRPGYQDIRLLRLLPGLQGTDIEIEILVIPLDSEPDYEALSYAWGCSDRTHSVLVQESEGASTNPPNHLELNSYKKKNQKRASLGIAQNLFISLQHLRYLNKPRLLWIDAICINQDDDDERSTQVLEMGLIYRNAREVVVWLGPAFPNSGIALQILKHISDSVHYSEEEKQLCQHAEEFADSVTTNAVTARSHSNSLFAVKEILRREWWSRLWVFQEITSANSASLVVGRDVISWKVAVAALYWIYTTRGYLTQQIESLNFEDVFEERILHFLNMGCDPRQYGLIKLLGTTCELSCSDPRDRLYAIRGLAYDSHAILLVPNYSLSVREVYVDFAKAWLSQIGNANIFHFGHQCEISTDLNLPSWVPDWTRIRDQSYSGGSSGASRVFPTFLEGDRLRIHGVLLGSLSCCTVPPKTTTTEDDIRELCKSWKKFVQISELGTGGGGSSSHKSFLEAIVGGNIAEKNSSLVRNLPSLDQIEAFVVDSGSIDHYWRNLLCFYIRRAISDQLLFQTAETYFGIGPRSAKLGDCLAVVLGCGLPLILRPYSNSNGRVFNVVGPCYVPGIMNDEALLGTLPLGWSAKEEKVDMLICTVFTNGSIKTQKDPRMPPLPSTWKYRYGEEGKEVEAKDLKDMEYQWFQNTESGEGSMCDPRLTPESLKERGVDIEELILV